MKQLSHPNKMTLQTRKQSSHHRGLIFSSISLLLIFLITIFAISFLCNNLSIHSPTLFSTKKHLLIIASATQTLETTQEDHDLNLNVMRELPILQSDDSIQSNNKSFDQKIQEFLNSNACESQFFMTWISPAPSFGIRENLALETLFKSHPNSCLIILSESLDSPSGNRILNQFSNLGFRIMAISPDIPLLLSNTPALNWYQKAQTGEIDVGQIPFSQNLSNLLRLAVLYKYGGVYLDTDFIILRNFSGLKNSICAQSMNEKTGEWWRLNNAILIFDKEHPLVMDFIEEFVRDFNGNKWGHNGPYLVSRVIQTVTARKKNEDDYNFTILPPTAFYPVDWTRISGLFKRPNTRAHKSWAKSKLAQLKSEKTFGVHLWNKQSSGLKIEEGSIIGRLISDKCLICKKIFNS